MRLVGIVVLAFIIVGLVNMRGNEKPAYERDFVQPTSGTKQEESMPVTTTENIYEESPIPYESKTVTDSSLNKDVRVTRTQGQDGVLRRTYEVVYYDGKQTDKRLVSEDTVRQPVSQVVAVGTKQQKQVSNCDPNYSPCIPYVSYDLDCGDIRKSVRVIGVDQHRFDRDGDGWGCESYGY